jgi:hypothetical protein
MSLRTSCIELVRVSAGQLADLSRVSIGQRHGGVLLLDAARRLSKTITRLAMRLWVSLEMARMSRCSVVTPRWPFRSRWYEMIPPYCVVKRSPVRHSIPAPPREKTRNDTLVATHARGNSIVVRGASVVPSCSMSRRTASARTNARYTTLVSIGTRMSGGARLTCDVANHLLTRASMSPIATGSRPWSL